MSAEDALLVRVCEWGEKRALGVLIEEGEVLRNESVTALPSIVLTDTPHRRSLSVRIVRSFDTIHVHAVLERILDDDVRCVTSKSLQIPLNSHGSTPCNSSCYDCFMLRLDKLFSGILADRPRGGGAAVPCGGTELCVDSFTSIASYLEITELLQFNLACKNTSIASECHSVWDTLLTRLCNRASRILSQTDVREQIASKRKASPKEAYKLAVAYLNKFTHGKSLARHVTNARTSGFASPLPSHYQYYPSYPSNFYPFFPSLGQSDVEPPPFPPPFLPPRLHFQQPRQLNYPRFEYWADNAMNVARNASLPSDHPSVTPLPGRAIWPNIRK